MKRVSTDVIRLKRKRRPKVTRIIILGFAAVIFVGAGLLMLPFATKSGHGISFFDALFTATSATCVTGLIIYNTFETFTAFGQVVIIVLIQIGGIGVMTLSSFIYLALSRRVPLFMRMSMREDVVDGSIGYVKMIVSRILILTAVCETLGAAVLTGAFSRYMPAGEAVWNGIFTSISAFCNAGFDISAVAGGSSLMPFSSDPLTLITVALLIIIGGLGFLVIVDMWERRRWRHFKLHTKVVLGVTASLILAGTIFFLSAEYNNAATMGNMNFGDKLLNSFFQSVTARTAGFNSVDIASMNPASRMVLDILMFIGASPGSTGGGIKTTSLFILIITVASVIRQKKFAVVDRQTVGAGTIHKAASVLVLALTVMLLSLLILLLSDGSKFGFEALLFEQISAYGTVGLSMGVTAGLSAVGRVIIMLNMFLGRIGVLSFFISFTKGKSADDGKVVYPECMIDV